MTLPPIVDTQTWQNARDELLLREKAHTREGDAIAVARRRLPMVEIDPATTVEGPDGPVPFIELFQGRDELLTYKHMWWDGAPHNGQSEGCTMTAWALRDAVYLRARGVSYALLTTGVWDEIAPFREFIGDSMGTISCFLRDGDRVFFTYSTTGRGTEVANGAFGLLDMTPYGRRETWQDVPDGWPEGNHACWYWRTGPDYSRVDWDDTRPSPQWSRPGATQTSGLGRTTMHH